jgi:hypothetical protein
MIEHLPCLLLMPIASPFFIYFEGESMLNVLGSLLVKLTKNRTKTHHKITIHTTKVGACSLTRSTSKAGGHARALGWD